MAIAYLTCNSGYLSPAGDPQTVSFNSGSTGSDRIMVLFFRIYDGRFSSVTYGGNSMTLGHTKIDFGTGSDDLYFYYLVNPPTGSNNIVFDYTSNDRAQWSAVVYTGVDQTTPKDASTGAGFSSGTEISSSLSSVADNCWHILCVCSNTSDFTAGTNFTSRCENNGNGSIIVGDNNSAKTPAGSVTQSVTGNSNNAGGYIHITLKPAAGSSGPANVKTYDGLAAASVKTINGLAIASVKTYNGLN
jgi:hypothetical protein